MPTIANIEDRLLILNSLIRRKELPDLWYQDSALNVSFETRDNRVTRVVVTREADNGITVTEYEPMYSKASLSEQSLFMLKTSEHRQQAPTVISNNRAVNSPY
ncbi:hypothetical protein QTP81_10915 [Alteromonas sp. ASW11-36]|uniref:Uncharacterized protein n=1 Tax=Alteromonas arenosi TaxID=3055817 RepID=A0ABT7SY47_9ALTE|nr:hypothetical protein [Alteromonas sp. ASW11-36]MDM7861108.1 hypothetical protein [Alteromonas sp. ASW11-36]